MSTKFISDLSKKEYNDFVLHHKQYSLLQSYDWYQVKNNFIPFHVGLKQEDKLVAAGLALLRPLALGYKIMYFPHGPILDYENLEIVTDFFSHLVKFAKKNKCISIKIDPFIFRKIYLQDDFHNQPSSLNCEIIEKNLHKFGFVLNPRTLSMEDTIQPRFIAVTHLNEELFKSYPKRLVQAQKYIKQRNVLVEKGSIEYLDDLAKMIELTEQRQKVNLRNKNYFKLLLDVYPQEASIYRSVIHPKKQYQLLSEKIHVLKQEIEEVKFKSPKKTFKLNEQLDSFEKQQHDLETIKDQEEVVIGALLSIRSENILELLYAGTDVSLSRFYPQEAIYSYIMEEAYQSGVNWVNMGGISGTLDDGLIGFKSNFNPFIHEKIGEFDYHISFISLFLKSAIKLRKKLNKKR